MPDTLLRIDISLHVPQDTKIFTSLALFVKRIGGLKSVCEKHSLRELRCYYMYKLWRFDSEDNSVIEGIVSFINRELLDAAIYLSEYNRDFIYYDPCDAVHLYQNDIYYMIFHTRCEGKRDLILKNVLSMYEEILLQDSSFLEVLIKLSKRLLYTHTYLKYLSKKNELF